MATCAGMVFEQIIVAGDSAGGGLAMALCHYLDQSRQTAIPCGIDCHVAVDGSDGKRGVLRYQLREGSPVWKDQGQPDLTIGIMWETTTRWMNIYHRCLAISEDFRRC